MFNVDFDKCRVIDVSRALVPGKEKRRLRIKRKLISIDDTFMHEIDTMSHIGTHIEGPSHFFKDGKDVTALSLSQFMGKAIVIDVDFTELHQPIIPTLLEKNVDEKEGIEVIILRNMKKSEFSGEAKDRHYLTVRLAQWLVDKKIKMLVFDNSFATGSNKDKIRRVHDILLSKDILLVEMVDNLDQLRKKEVYFMALPLKIKGIDSSPVRAIVIEPES